MRSALPLATLALLTLAASAPFAAAQSVSGNGGGFGGSGTLNTTSNGNGSYTINSLTIDTPGVGGLLPNMSFNGNDNLLFTSSGSPLVDGHGFAFTDTLGDTSYNVDIFSTSSSSTGYEAYIVDSDGDNDSTPVCFSLGNDCTSSSQSAASFARLFALDYPAAGTPQTFSFDFAGTTAPTPEPASFVLLGSGLAGIAGMLRRRRS